MKETLSQSSMSAFEDGRSPDLRSSEARSDNPDLQSMASKNIEPRHLRSSYFPDMLCMKRVYRDIRLGPSVSSQERRAAAVLVTNCSSTARQLVDKETSTARRVPRFPKMSYMKYVYIYTRRRSTAQQRGRKNDQIPLENCSLRARIFHSVEI